PPNYPFSGSLLLDGQRTDAATTLADLERHPTISFRRHFNDGLYAEGEAVIIDVSVRDWRSKGKQRKRSRTVAWVALQFRDRCESVAGYNDSN
ncbi:MAG: hypothetical protein ACK5Q5_03110, partial [Planctomycetaceae bacterium]